MAVAVVALTRLPMAAAIAVLVVAMVQAVAAMGVVMARVRVEMMAAPEEETTGARVRVEMMAAPEEETTDPVGVTPATADESGFTDQASYDMKSNPTLSTPAKVLIGTAAAGGIVALAYLFGRKPVAPIVTLPVVPGDGSNDSDSNDGSDDGSGN